MGHEIDQLDISGIQLRESKTQPKVSLSREIGEAKIVHTIFGRAKVRIIRKHDKFRRALWQTALFVVAVAAAFTWQDWYASQQTESIQSGESARPASEVTRERAQALQPEAVVAPSITPAAEIEPPPETRKPAIGHNVPQPHSAMKGAGKEAGKEAEKPAAVQPKPVVIPPKPAAITQRPATAGVTQISPAVPALPKPPVVATGAKTAVPASAAVAAPALASPLVGDEAAKHAPVVDKQLAAPINMPSN